MDNMNSFCAELRVLLQSTKSQSEIFRRGRVLLSSLALKPIFLKEVLRKYVTDDEFLKKRRLTFDPNEITIFVDPDGLFSLRIYVWDPAMSYPVHSHGSWGVVAGVAGEILERKFKIIDKGDRPGFAKLQESSKGFLKPGDTTTVLPLDLGIHRMEPAVKEPASISLHLYGKAVRSGYLECYDLQKNSSYRVMNPFIYGKACAIRALGAIGEDWAAEFLGQAVADKKTHIRYEAMRALARLDKEAALQLIEEEMIKEIHPASNFRQLYSQIKNN
jgi:predicted metal-dependent enzyme (double-stranded beta helix superfamily)